MFKRVPQIVIRSAAGLLAAAVVVTAWRAAYPPEAHRAAARIQIAEDAVTSVAGELAALEGQIAGTPMAVTRVEGASAIELSLQSDDPEVSARTVNQAVDVYLRIRTDERARRARALLAETRAAITQQQAVVARAEQERASAQALLARGRQDRASVVTQLKSVEASLAAARARVAELAPLAGPIKSGRSAASLNAVQAMPFVQVMQERIAALDDERAALVGRYGASHPDVERSSRAREKASAELQAQLASLSATLLRDYEAALLEQEVLERERQAIFRRPDGPLPSGVEYLALSRQAEDARAALATLERRAEELDRVEGTPVARAERAVPARPMVPPPTPWPWALALAAAFVAAWAAPSLLRSIGGATREEP